MKSKSFFAVIMMAAMLFSACEGNDPSQTVENNYEQGMYVGITGFSDAVQYFGSSQDRYEVLTSSNVYSYNTFISKLQMGDATVLYYAVDNNLDYLQKCKFPDDLSSVNIITFTDGLNQGSRALDKKDGNHDYAVSDESYVAEIHRKIETMRVQGLPINAYAIGIRGKDVAGDAATVFKDNLLKLSSTQDNAMEVSNMDEVSVRFKEIAASLYRKTESTNLTITIPMPSDNEIERFTFDDVTDATASQCYLEGVYANSALTNIKYVGCMSNSGTTVQEQEAGGVKIKFEFENFTDESGQAISTQHMQQWHMSPGQSTWTRNSEFKPDESIETKEERKTAVVMLILDCSSSLGSDFTKVKEAANDFIRTLSGDIAGYSGTETTYYINHPWGWGDTWSWQPMTREGNNYVYTDLWGGEGAKVNSKPDHSGAKWYHAGNINGSSSLRIGEQVKFSYNPVNESLKVTLISTWMDTAAKVRFRKESDNDRYSLMALFADENPEQSFFCSFFMSSGTSSYYDIPSGIYVPMIYDEEISAYLNAIPERTWTFSSKKKYTFSMGFEGENVVCNIYEDGSFNAPAQSKLVYHKRIRRSDMVIAPMVRR